MTKIYFVRHAQPEHNWEDDRTRPLTAEGKEDSKVVLDFFKEKNVDAFYASPYERSIDTIRETAEFFGKEIIYKIRIMSLQEISEIADVSEGLENKIKSAASSCNTFDELVEKIKSKRYTLSRIHRILLCILLGITKKDISNSYKTTPYIRVLAMNNHGKKLVSELSRNKNLNIITSTKQFLEKNNNRNL
ncbi:MAG: nucleotidyltransferase family protein, partial [Lachnospira sp.]|nr:nucleotidyltransferase family protein [Lachnospira sp.]